MKEPDCLKKTAEQRKVIEDEAMEKHMAYLTINRSNKDICERLKDNMKEQHSLGQEQYPKTLARAMEILNQNYKSPRKHRNNDDNNDRNNNSNQDNNNANDGNNNEDARLFAQMENRRCFKCGRANCRGKQGCPMKDKPPEEWAANHAMMNMERDSTQSHAQVSTDDSSVASTITNNGTNTSNTSTNSNNRNGMPTWMMFQATYQFANLNCDIKDCILLDNQSGESLFGTKWLVKQHSKFRRYTRNYYKRRFYDGEQSCRSQTMGHCAL